MDIEPMSEIWQAAARRIVQSVRARPGELVLVRDGAGEPRMLRALALQIEEAGATPLIEITDAAYIGEMLRRTSADHLAHWDAHRVRWIEAAQRRVTLQTVGKAMGEVPAEALQQWEKAVQRITHLEEQRHTPVVIVAVPTGEAAASLDMATTHLEDLVLSSITVPVAELQREIGRALRLIGGDTEIEIHTGEGCVLRMELAARQWLGDNGVVEDDDRARGASVSNLPGGSIYVPPPEDSASGTLHLPSAGPAREVTLTFHNGTVTEIDAVDGREELSRLFDRHGEGSRKLSHVGIGLNPHLRRPVGWVLLDEHVHGSLFAAFGENRYMGGENASSLNIDFVIPGATLIAGGRTIVERGKLAGDGALPRS